MDWEKTTAMRDEKHLNLGAAYVRYLAVRIRSGLCCILSLFGRNYFTHILQGYSAEPGTIIHIHIHRKVHVCNVPPVKTTQQGTVCICNGIYWLYLTGTNDRSNTKYSCLYSRVPSHKFIDADKKYVCSYQQPPPPPKKKKKKKNVNLMYFHCAIHITRFQYILLSQELQCPISMLFGTMGFTHILQGLYSLRRHRLIGNRNSHY